MGVDSPPVLFLHLHSFDKHFLSLEGLLTYPFLLSAIRQRCTQDPASSVLEIYLLVLALFGLCDLRQISSLP